jgi:hypothetical protein
MPAWEIQESFMTDPDQEPCEPLPPQLPSDPFASEMPVGLTLEGIIDLTGEIEHLNELVMLQLDKCGGFSSPAAYFTAVQPILDQLEAEIRVQYRTGMSRQDMKQVIGDWIDTEISSLQ